MSPLPDEIEAGLAYGPTPLDEQFQREPNPWNPGGAQGLGQAVAPAPPAAQASGPSVTMVPPPAPPGAAATPWAQGPTALGPADFAGATDGRVPPPASMPAGLGGARLNLSAVAEQDAIEEDADDLSADEQRRAVAYLNLSDALGPVRAAQEDPDGLALAMRVSMRGDSYDAAKAKTAIGALEPGDNWSWDYGVSVRRLQMAEGEQSLWTLDQGYGWEEESDSAPEGPREVVYTDVDKLMTGVGAAVAAQQARVAARKLRDKMRSAYGLSQDGAHQATVAWNLAEDGGVVKDGVLWKVLCKTGTLALSPGPGQIDVDKPLQLTPDLFMAAKSAYDDGAYEHVIIPKTHEGVADVMQNTGTVSALDVLTHADAVKDVRLSAKAKAAIKDDDATTLYMLGGLSFTDQEVKKKAAEGSILNCSVGFKFNVRPNKLTGTTYPVAIEHVALTNQPWVYGLPAFGADLSDGRKPDEAVWDGVFMSADSRGAVALVEDPHAAPGAALPGGGAPGELRTTPNDGTNPGDEIVARETDEDEITLETILAQHQADLEALRAEGAEKDAMIANQGALLSQTSEQLHKGTVAAKIKALQDEKGPGGQPRYAPAVLTRVEAVLLAAKPSLDGQGDGALSLSASVPTADGNGVEQKDFKTVESLVDFILSAVPAPTGDADDAAAAAIALAQRPGGPDAVDEAAKTAKAADAIEKRLHPDRFDAEGKRIPASERKKR